MQDDVTFCYNGSSIRETYLMFHMNWGWQELGVTNNFNGWFAFQDWTVNGTSFNFFNELDYNIHP